jgi:acyl-CoA synthetase (AMP-forming)/AMP-acid ligase II
MEMFYMRFDTLMTQEFTTASDLIHALAREQPQAPALRQDGRSLSYGELDALMDRVAAALQRDGFQPLDTISICAGTSIEYAVVFLGSLRAGVTVAPLAPSSTAQSLAGMIANAEARLLFLDSDIAEALTPVRQTISADFVALDDSGAGSAFSAWLAPVGARPAPVDIQPEWPFNIIYSSGTTGTPKGIVQPHIMRWGHIRRGSNQGFGPGAISLLSTPLYSNTTLVTFFQTIALGGLVLLMPRFNPTAYLELAQRERVTHTMLVPVQYQRLMALPEFDRYDLSSFRYKFSTSAPFGAALQAEVLRRWPGGLIEVYGMTEGGGTCMLAAHEHPDKLHTIGKPAPGHDIRLIDDDGRELPPGAIGELVGRSPNMMLGYHKQPEATAEAEWHDAEGNRFIRTGDIGRFDEDGFVTLLDRKKDMIISGGFNIYPSDLEAVLREHPALADVSVVGMPSTRWGETPVAFAVAKAGAHPDPDEVLGWANERLGRTQRLAALEFVDVLPRSAIGKVLKRELRDAYAEKIVALG